MNPEPQGNSRRASVLILLLLALLVGGSRGARADSNEALDRESRAALKMLVEKNASARKLADTAAGILVFPSILKAGFMFGGQMGNGVLFEKGAPTGHYNSVAASYGFQAGIQKFGYALFFMDGASLREFRNSSGFEIGSGPSVVVVDEGFGKTMSTTTVRKGIYAIIFDQRGAMAGLGIQGTKITRIPE